MKYRISSGLLGLALILTGFGTQRAEASVSPAGSLAIENSTVYLITSDGLRRPYTSEAAFKSYSYNDWALVKSASPEDALLKIGSPVPPREGSVICSTSEADLGSCYLVTEGKKAKFATRDLISSYGIDLKNVLQGDISFLDAAPDISSLDQAHRPGTVIKNSDTYYLIGKNGLIGVPTEPILNSWGYRTSDTVEANQLDKNLKEKFVLESRGVNELKPYEPVIPAPLELSNENKFSIPFKGNSLPTMTESWLYSTEERSIHGYINHGGIDFATRRNAPVYAAADGYAISSTHLVPLNKTHDGKTPLGFGLGEFVQIWHPDQGVYTSYSHLGRVNTSIPYFKPTCDSTGYCDPTVVYKPTSFSEDKGLFVKRGTLIGHAGDSGLSLGYEEKPRKKRPDPEKYPSWDEVHLHFELYTRNPETYTKQRRYDPFNIYGRLDQYTPESYSNAENLWKKYKSGNPVFAR